MSNCLTISSSFVSKLIEFRRMSISATIQAHEQLKVIAQQELDEDARFAGQLKYFERVVKEFSSILVERRRQRALQLNINLRKERLASMRDQRLRHLKEKKEAQMAVEKEAKAITAAKMAAKRTFANIVATNAKAGIRGAKDLYRELR